MSNTFKEALAAREDQRWEAKLASVEEAFAGDSEALTVFNAAVDMVKEAGVTDPYQVIDDAIELTIAAYADDGTAGKTVEASATESDSIDYNALGMVAAQVANAAGITSDEVEKIASDDENEALGRLLAHCVLAELQQGA